MLQAVSIFLEKIYCDSFATIKNDVFLATQFELKKYSKDIKDH